MEKQQLQQQQQPANSSHDPAPLNTDPTPSHNSEDRQQQQLGSIPESGEEKGMQETEGEKEEEEEEERLTPPLPKENKVYRQRFCLNKLIFLLLSLLTFANVEVPYRIPRCNTGPCVLN